MVSIDVATDTASIKEKIAAFVTAYNDFMKFVGEQRTAAAGGDATSIGREPLLRNLHGILRSALAGAHGTGALSRLAEVGLEMTSAGQLKLNESMFDAAIEATFGEFVDREESVVDRWGGQRVEPGRGFADFVVEHRGLAG